MLLIQFSFAAFGNADQIYTNKELELSFNYSDEFSIRDTAHPAGLIVALGPKGRDFPTFNIIRQPASEENTTLEREAKSVLDGYHSVGFTEAKIVKAELTTFKNFSAPVVTLRYAMGSTFYLSTVTLINTSDAQLVLTFIGKESDAASDLKSLQILLNSFSVKGNETGIETQKSIFTLAAAVMLIPMACAILFAFLWVNNRRRLNRLSDHSA